MVIDDPQAATPSLASPRVRPSQLAKATRPLDDISRLGIVCEMELQLPVLVIVQVLGKELREERRLDELQHPSIRNLRMFVKLPRGHPARRRAIPTEELYGAGAQS